MDVEVTELHSLIQRKIKDCPGIAKQVRGKVVYVEPHPKFKGAWRFEFNGETWVGSVWALKIEVY